MSSIWVRITLALLALCLSRPLPALTTWHPQEAMAKPSAPEESDVDEAEEAQESEERSNFKEEIVVSANRIPTPAESVGSAVTVISREDIERSNQPYVLDLMRTVPGLQVEQSGGPGALSQVYLRGARANQTLVLIDGIPVTGAAGFDFSLLRTNNIERIEVLRGPQSTLYGSEAIGGVISIVTRRGEPGLRAGVDGRYGTRDTRDLSVSVDGGRNGFDYSVSASDRQTDGISQASELRGNHERDSFSDEHFSTRLGYSLRSEGRLDLTARYMDGETSLDGFSFGIGPIDDVNFVQRRRLSVVSLQLTQPLTDAWNLSVNLGTAREKTLGEDPNDFFNNYDIRHRHNALTAQSELKLSDDNTLIAGVATDRRNGSNAGSYDESINVDSIYVQDSWSMVDRLFVTLGARHDRYSRFGDKTTYRLTGSYAWLPWRLHGSLGTGFRGPSLDELFFPFVGNPNLQPESSTGVDLGLERDFLGGNVSADVTVFHSRFENLIDFDFLTSTFSNARRAETQGIEAQLQLQPRTGLALRSSYTYMETEDGDTGLRLARRPQHKGTLLAIFEPAGRLRGTASLVAVEDRIDSDGTKMDSYQRVDLTLQYRIRSGLEPYLLVQNIFDQSYEEVSGYTAPGRFVFAGLRFRHSS